MNKEEAKANLPDPSFSSLVMSIASAAVIKMGLDPNYKDQKDLTIAKYNIDLLSVLKEKTKSHLTSEEEKLLDSCVSDLQIQYVRISNNKEA